MKNAEQVREYMDRVLSRSKDSDELYKRADEAHRYASPLGDQWNEADRRKAKDNKVPAMSVNKVFPIINSVAGRESTNRYRPKYFGMDETDAGQAECQNEWLRKVREKGDEEQLESELFNRCVTSGYSWAHYPTVLHDVIPEEEMELVSVWEMMWDPFASKINAKDREWHARGRTVSLFEFRKIYGELETVAPESYEHDWDDDQLMEDSSRIPWIGMAGEKPQQPKRDGVFVVEFEWKEIEDYFRIEVPVLLNETTGEPLDLEDLPLDQLAQLLFAVQTQKVPIQGTMELEWDVQQFRAFQTVYKKLSGDVPYPSFLRLSRDCYYYAIRAGSKILDHGKRPENYWTYVPMFGFPHHDRDGQKWFGIVEVCRAFQDKLNRMESLNLQGHANQVKGGVFASESEDVPMIERKYAQPGAVIPVRDPDNIKPIDRGNLPADTWQHIQQADQGISAAIGVSPYSTGGVHDLKRTASSSITQLQEASMTVLTPLFDALKHFRKEVARVRAAKLNAYWDRESVTRIIGEKLAARLLPKSMWKDFQKWDILIDEVPATATQQKEFLSALLEQGALPHMSQLGYHPPPEVLIEAFDIGSEKKEEWKAAIQQRMLAAQNAPPDEEGAPPQ